MTCATKPLDTAVDISPSFTNRQLVPSDGDLLGTLIFRALHGSIDDAGESESFWREEARVYLAKNTDLFWHASSIIVSGDKPVSTVAISAEEGVAFLVYAMTDPHFQGQGLASAQILSSLDMLYRSKIERLKLCVTEQNDRALRLYQKLGFVVDSEFYHLKVVFK